jgi:hypothetical protein
LIVDLAARLTYKEKSINRCLVVVNAYSKRFLGHVAAAEGFYPTFRSLIDRFSENW